MWLQQYDKGSCNHNDLRILEADAIATACESSEPMQSQRPEKPRSRCNRNGLRNLGAGSPAARLLRATGAEMATGMMGIHAAELRVIGSADPPKPSPSITHY